MNKKRTRSDHSPPGNERDPEAEYRAEAERLAAIPLADQDIILDMHRSVAENPKVPKADREEAGRRLEALKRHLKRLRGKGK